MMACDHFLEGSTAVNVLLMHFVFVLNTVQASEVEDEGEEEDDGGDDVDGEENEEDEVR